MFVCYTSDQPCWTRKANTNNNHNKWLHEFLISLRWGNHNSLLCRCCHLTSQQPLEFTIDTSKITFYYVSLIKKYWPKWAWQVKRTQLSISPVTGYYQLPRNNRGVRASLICQAHESNASETSAVKKNSDFCRHSVKFHCICNTLRSDYRSQCNLGDQLIFYYLCMLFKLFPMCFLFTCYSYWYRPVPSFSYLLIFFRKCSGAP